RRTGKGDVADQNPPLDLPVNRGTSRNGPLGTNDDPAALEGDIDLGLQDARKGHLQQEIVSLFKKIKDEIEKRLGHSPCIIPSRSCSLALIDGRFQRARPGGRVERSDGPEDRRHRTPRRSPRGGPPRSGE